MRARTLRSGGGLLDCEGVVEGNRVARGAIAERDRALDVEKVYVRFGDGRRVCLVQLVDTVRGNRWTRVQLRRGKQTVPLHTHHCILRAKACLNADHSNDFRDSRTCCCRHHVRDAVETVTMRTRHRVARGHTHTLHLQRRQVMTDGRDVTRRWKLDTARGTAGVTVGGQGIVALPDATYEIGVPAHPTRVWHVCINAVRSVIMI